MRYTVLCDNTTLIDRYFRAEPGFSLWIEEQGTKILFDTGYSDVFIGNAYRMAIPLRDTDYIVLSHGHIDHTGGMGPLLRLLAENEWEGGAARRPAVVAHPDVFSRRVKGDAGDTGCDISADIISGRTNLTLSAAPVWITESCVFLGEIPRTFSFEAWEPRGKLLTPGGWVDDRIPDDSALALLTPEGLVIVTGCSHAGICSMIDYAIQVTGENRIADIIGGLHLYRATPDRILKTAEYLEDIAPGEVHACHCTGLRAQVAFANYVNLQETGVGLHCSFP
ncbi:MAG: MBL fold metallo-hydrolase [Methanomicrobiaceae archaeon]|nr:MBL fold metallo-hydrolase [Methanomicrobiaceae archaeon]